MQANQTAPLYKAGGSHKHVILVEVDRPTFEQLEAEARRYKSSFQDVVRSRLSQAPFAVALAVAQNPSRN